MPYGIYRSISFDPESFTEREWGYLAGLIDGEGSVHITFHNQYGVEVTNTNPRVIDFCMRFGGNWYRKPPRQDHHKMAYRWRNFKATDVETILVHCMPSLIIKRRRAGIVISSIHQRLLVARRML